MSKPLQDTFGDRFKCPVCQDLFYGKIFLCVNGHSMCELCRELCIKHCETAKCPECRGEFSGAINYALQEAVQHLVDLRTMVSTTSDIAGSSDANANASDSCCDDIDDAKLKEAIAVLVKSIPKPENHRENDYAKPSNDKGNEPRNEPELDPIVHATSRFPLQPRGKFTCRICEDVVPICRMINHLRTFHKESFDEEPLRDGDHEFTTLYEFDCKTFRRAIRINQYGVFFLLVNVHYDGEKTLITSWMQCPSLNADCKLFTFQLNMRIGNVGARYSDYAHGENSKAEYIKQKKHCLYYETNMSPNDIGNIAVYVKVLKSMYERGVRERRHTNTEVGAVSDLFLHL